MDASASTEGLINGHHRIGIPWVVTTGFVRLMTHPRVLTNPMTTSTALDSVEQWFQVPHVTPLNPGSRHLTLFRQLLDQAGVGANLVTDAHLATLALEYQAELHSNDSDFGRFSGLNWVNPIV